MSCVNRMNFLMDRNGATTESKRCVMKEVLASLGLSPSNPGGFSGAWSGSGKAQRVVSPIDGEALATVTNVTPQEFETVLAKCHQAFASWKLVPAPKRGEVVKEIGDELRRNKEALAQ